VIGKLKGKKVIATQAKTKVTTKRVVIGAAHVTLSARQHKSLVVALNATGKSILGSHKRLAVGLTVSSTGKTLKAATVSITHPAPPKKKKK
jgi:hypothetical protein